MSFRQALTKFIEENLLQDVQDLTLKPDTNLIESGLIDSMSLQQLLLFVENQTGFRIPDDQVLPENFETISSIERLIDSLR